MRQRRCDSGFSLIEVLIAMGITTTALFGLVSVITYSTRSNMASRENATALRAAEKKIESMKATAFESIFSTYSAAGASTFAVPEFDTVKKDAQGLSEADRRKLEILKPQAAGLSVGTIKFPVDATNQLLETETGLLMDNRDDKGVLVDIDLDGDGVVETTLSPPQNKSTTRLILPVKIEIKWKGVLGNRELTFRHLFMKK